ncbi:hypothetical protein OBBRIDRAFT_886994 [Obba rivulosa]|uniref:GATA-type domain-containing protein n=1 Tax=Obba rivulosa TaxID=1052685 RepID=A0A8E2DKE1_9APHY|nr:hypothetical protein OBBRIDRAFT_886994 [Obba rivulosa]
MPSDISPAPAARPDHPPPSASPPHQPPPPASRDHPSGVTDTVTSPAHPPYKRLAPLPSPPAPLHIDHRWQSPYYAPVYYPSYYRYPVEPAPYHRTMPHRVDSSDRLSGHRSDDSGHYQLMHAHPTPPPIATLHHSPALSTSSLGSSISPSPPGSQPSTPYYGHPAQSQQYLHNSSASLSARYSADGINTSAHHSSSFAAPTHVMPGHVSTRSIRPTFVTSQPYPGQATYMVYTDDAATKLSDRVRRKCYNCRTTDTSTWRRSSLTPGKVLCNKCGLFERTHSRPRPEQFPHKRGPLVTATFKSSRTPPPQARLPPMSTHMHALPPHHYSHPSIAPLMGRAEVQNGYAAANTNGLPEIRTLLNPAAGDAQHVPTQQQLAQDGGEDQKQLVESPAQQHAEMSPRSERREVPAYRSTN